MKKLILFDIDGTLIRSNGVGRLAMIAALEEVFGTAGPVDDYQMGGKVDHRIITDLMTSAGFTPEEIKAKINLVCDHMAVKALAIFPGKEMSVCTGVKPLLQALSQREDALLGLLTGNICRTAPIKLAAAGLNPLQFRVGAYGCDALDRNALPAIAMQRAGEMSGDAFAGHNTVIIGDTPADILCARAGQAMAVAVASGWHSMSTLSQYQPDFLFANLSDTTAVVEALLTP